jgi:meso-butanediol dehydrogenase / (S,S)-butanediol dehydrogenase / diacetyl reductase
MLRGTGQARKSTTTRMNPSPESTRPPRTALVTGAGSGIGEACVTRFLDDGWDVIGWDVRPGGDARVRWATVDVSDWDAVASEAASAPPLAAVVNCAGIARITPTLSMSREDWDRTLAINLNGAYYVSRHLYEPLRAAGGVLVQVASVNAKNTTRFRAPYNASKAGLVSLTQALAVEWALENSGIRVFCVSPGITRTQTATIRIEQGLIDERTLLDRIPTRRWIETSEIASAIVGLIGGDFSALHGANVIIDAGYDAWGGHL